jgi:hypothetical protein
MSIFSAFNVLKTSINNAYSNLTQSASSINGFSNTTNALTNAFNSTTNDLLNAFGTTGSNMSTAVGVVDNAINAGGTVGNVGSAIRMVGNAAQNVGIGAAPQQKQVTTASISNNVSSQQNGDWRVSLSVPDIIMSGEVLKPLGRTFNKMVFPFTPTILIGHSANYTQIHPTHTNFPYNAYENSQVDNYTITGEFINETTEDAQYWVACLHFLRTATKMFYGEGEANTLGLPPVVSRLNGYGKHVLNNIPVVITNFTTDLPSDVDYIETTVDGQSNYVPVQCTITVTCSPQYARRSQARFSLKQFAEGGFVGSPEGFV